jgi:hypothetical protein
MGLDWNPGSKAKPGFETEWRELWLKLHSKTCLFREDKKKRFAQIATTAFETLRTPRVGFDASATEWAKTTFPNRVDKSLTEDVFIERMRGFYVLDLIAPCDGLPRYTNGHPGGYVERYAFRGQFLKDCQDILGKDLLESGYVSKLPEDTVEHGDKLLESAAAFAASRNLNLTQVHLAEEPDTVEFHLDVVLAAGKWCQFWGEKGHWLEAYW